MTPGVLVISKQALLRDLERACFVWRKKRLSSHRTSKQICRGCSHPLGGSRVFVGDREAGRPLAVSSWPLRRWRAEAGHGLHVPLAGCPQAGVGKSRQDGRSGVGTRMEPSDSICRFLRNREKGDGESLRRVGPPPTSWHCNQHLPTAKITFLPPHHHFSDSLKPLVFSHHSQLFLHLLRFFWSNFTMLHNKIRNADFSLRFNRSEMLSAWAVPLLLLSEVHSSQIQY